MSEMTEQLLQTDLRVNNKQRSSMGHHTNLKRCFQHILHCLLPEQTFSDLLYVQEVLSYVIYLILLKWVKTS